MKYAIEQGALVLRSEDKADSRIIRISTIAYVKQTKECVHLWTGDGKANDSNLIVEFRDTEQADQFMSEISPVLAGCWAQG